MHYCIMHKNIFFSSKVIQTEIYNNFTIIKGTLPEIDHSPINNLIFVLLRQLAILRVFISALDIMLSRAKCRKKGRTFQMAFQAIFRKARERICSELLFLRFSKQQNNTLQNSLTRKT